MSFTAQFGAQNWTKSNRPQARRGNWGTKAPYNPNNANGYNAPQAQYVPRKHSGASMKHGKNGKPCISGWNVSRQGFLTCIATENGLKHIGKTNGDVILNDKGQAYARWTAQVVHRSTGQVSTHSALFNTATNKLYIPDLNMVLNPYAPNGGYFGKCSRPKR